MNEKLKHLDLFSGIGGFALGLESTGGFETVGFCDNEPFAQKVLKKHWPDVPCYEDVRDVGVDTVGYRGVDIITGGFPCQPYSVAGKQDPNDNRQLWPEMFRIIKEIRPTYVIGENVRNLISIREGVVFEQVCTDLEGEGYEVQTFVLPASAVNAPHQRYRCWIVAYSRCINERSKKKSEWTSSDTTGCSGRTYSRSEGIHETNVADTNSRRSFSKHSTTISRENQRIRSEHEGSGSRIKREKTKDVANSDSTRTWKHKENLRKTQQKKGRVWFKSNCEDARELSRSEEHRQESTGSRMGGTIDGLSKGLDRHWGDGWEEGTPRVAEGQKNRANRLKGLGNAVVPQIPAVLGRAILEVHNG